MNHPEVTHFHPIMLEEELFQFCRPKDYWPLKPVPGMNVLNRWRLAGVLGNNGQRVKLETLKVGGRRYTSKEAVARFIVAQNEPASKKVSARKGPTDSEILEAMGM